MPCADSSGPTSTAAFHAPQSVFFGPRALSHPRKGCPTQVHRQAEMLRDEQVLGISPPPTTVAQATIIFHGITTKSLSLDLPASVFLPVREEKAFCNEYIE